MSYFPERFLSEIQIVEPKPKSKPEPQPQLQLFPAAEPIPDHKPEAKKDDATAPDKDQPKIKPTEERLDVAPEAVNPEMNVSEDPDNPDGGIGVNPPHFNLSVCFKPNKTLAKQIINF